ncbi:MAG: hypothetical protein FJY80_01935 [Candidatus Aminicenantes bacterium]|nr:hypothetical protein [Candidatus Aminicenantes bacterium]
MRKTTLVIFALSIVLWPSCRDRDGKDVLPQKGSITVVVADSGLGGLSITAEAAARLKEMRAYRSVDLVFANALFSNDSGYNSLPDRESKIRVFDRALRGIAANTQPDVILVGCNTLSVLTGDVPFVRASKTPVIGIVDSGVDMIVRALEASPGAAVVLFGTETTIAEGTHRQKLIERGISADRILPQACPELAAYIESDWRSDDTALLIESYVDEALGKLPDRGKPVIAALVCTHYGYAHGLWEKAFAARGAALNAILNPNEAMVEAVFPAAAKPRFSETAVRARVLSMVEIAEGKRASLGDWLGRVSPEVASALRSCELVPDLFVWQDIVR